MHPKIYDSFWTDLDFERFTGQELANHRLTFLWTFGSPIVNAAGIFPLHPRAFTGDTGLPYQQLLDTVNAFPRAFIIDPERGQCVLLKNYVRYQIGTGAKLASDNIAAAVIKALRNSPPTLAQLVLDTYPELRQHRYFRTSSEALPKGLPSPYEALPKGLPHSNVPQGTLPATKPLPSPCQGLLEDPSKGKGISKGKSSSIGGAGGDSEVTTPSVDEVITWGQFDGVPEACCRDFWDWHESRGWMSGQTPIRAPRRLLKSYHHTWQERQARLGKNKTGPDAQGLPQSPDDLRAALQTERDPARRAALEEKLRAL